MSLDKGKMPKIDANNFKFALVASRFNKNYVDALVNDALATLKKHGAKSENIRVMRVPGAAELPTIASMLANSGEFDAIISMGVVIAGETPHHEIIAHSTANALQQIAVETSVPMINGIIVTNNDAQAKARTVGEIKRGIEFAEAAIEMANLTEFIGKEFNTDLITENYFDEIFDGDSEDFDLEEGYIDFDDEK